MKVDLRKRGTGKTTDLIQRSLDTGLHLVVIDEKEKRRIEQILLDEDIFFTDFHFPRIFTIDEIKLKAYKGLSPRPKGFLVDNAEVIINDFFGNENNVDTITLSYEEDFYDTEVEPKPKRTLEHWAAILGSITVVTLVTLYFINR